MAVDSAQERNDLPFVQEVFQRVGGKAKEATEYMKWHEDWEPQKEDYQKKAVHEWRQRYDTEWKQWRDVLTKWQLHVKKFKFASWTRRNKLAVITYHVLL